VNKVQKLNNPIRFVLFKFQKLKFTLPIKAFKRVGDCYILTIRTDIQSGIIFATRLQEHVTVGGKDTNVASETATEELRQKPFEATVQTA
jgi:hypothetical protein